MKYHKFKSFLAVMSLIALIACLFAPQAAQAQTAATTLGTFSGLPPTIATTVTTNVASNITVRQGKGVTISPLMSGSGASTDDVVFTFKLSLDGTNYTTLTPLSFTNALTGTTAVRGYYRFSAEQLAGCRKLQLFSIENTTSVTLNLTNVTYSIE